MYIKSGDTDIYIADFAQVLEQKLGHLSNNQIFVLVDKHTRKYCWPLLAEIPQLSDSRLLEVDFGEQAKSIDTVIEVWRQLTHFRADRHSVLINLGGGMVGDLGGFAASCYKRGMAFIQMPTTLLSMVDASVGGKTGVNFQGLKNQIGVFSQPQAVIIDSQFLRTLDRRQWFSGWAEMIKHALLQGPADFDALRRHNPGQISHKELNQLIARSVQIKHKIASSDFTETGVRKILNLGHTVGHAIESAAMHTENPLLHGEAVAYGLAVEVLLAKNVMNLDADLANSVVGYVLQTYQLPYRHLSKEHLMQLIQHDKKNAAGKLLFALLNREACPEYDIEVSSDEVMKAFCEFDEMYLRFS